MAAANRNVQQRLSPIGVVYLLHFDEAYQHARHYTGWTSDDVLTRIARHSQGHGARLMQVIRDAGIGFSLVRVCEGTRYTEREIKQAGGASRYCPACTTWPRNGRWGDFPAGLVPRHYPCTRVSGAQDWALIA
jgi:predicted GIY-YIG superfamily endonuclease